jgi:peroxiredoxin
MLNTRSRRLENFANIAVILVAVVFLVLVGVRYFYPKLQERTQTKPEPPSADKLIGKQVSLSGMDWAKHGHSLVFALQTHCRFCTESAPAFKDLVNQAKELNVQSVGIFPEPVEESKTYLGSFGIAMDSISQDKLTSVGVAVTPTLLLVDEKGVVKYAWIGKFDVNRTREVLNRLQTKS